MRKVGDGGVGWGQFTEGVAQLLVLGVLCGLPLS